MRIDAIRGDDIGAGGRFQLAMAASFKANTTAPVAPMAEPVPDIRAITPRDMAQYGVRLFAAGAIDIHTLHRFQRELIATDGTPAADIAMDFAAQARERLARLDAVFEPKSSTSYRSLRRLLDFAAK